MKKKVFSRFILGLVLVLLLVIVFAMGSVSINSFVNDFAKKVGLEDTLEHILPAEPLETAYAWETRSGIWPNDIGNTGDLWLNQYCNTHWKLYMSSGGSGDDKSTSNTLYMDQGGSTGKRNGNHSIVLNLTTALQNAIRTGNFTFHFTANVHAGNPDYNKLKFRMEILNSSNGVLASHEEQVWGSGASQGKGSTDSAASRYLTWTRGATANAAKLKIIIHTDKDSGTFNPRHMDLYANSMKLNIKSNISLAADNKSKTYGDSDPALTWRVSSGAMVAGETLSGTLTRGSGNDVGTYSITRNNLGTADSLRYNITGFTNGTFTINKRNITVTADSHTLYYGQDPRSLTYRITSGSLAYSDSITGAVTRPNNNNAGEYNITQGTLTINKINNYNLSFNNGKYTINKAGLSIDSIQSTPILYGQKLSNSSLTARVMNPYNGQIVEGVFQWQNPNLVSRATGETTVFTENFNFLPTDSANHLSLTSQQANITMIVSTKLEVVRHGTNPTQNTFGYDFATTSVVNGKARMGLKAEPYLAGNYVFVGWQKGGNYISTNPNTVYEFTSDSPSEIETTFRAVFAQYTIDRQVLTTVNKNYTGGLNRIELRIDLLEQGGGPLYGISNTPLVYSSGSAPTAVGNYTVTFTIRNTMLNQIVASPVINLNVLENDVIVDVDTNSSLGYNINTGWAHSVTFVLRVAGVQSGAVEKYIYTTDNGATWQDVPGGPQSSLDCPIIFEASPPGGEEGQSLSIPYRFKAVHSTNGIGEHSSVATSSDTTYCKIDTVAPSFDITLQNNYDGSWTNQDVVVAFNGTIGGSGALILYSTDGGINWHDTGIIEYNMGEASGLVNLDKVWILEQEQMELYSFRIQSGTGKEATSQLEYGVKIDKTAPVFGSTTINKEGNEYGWINEDTTATFTVTERQGDSGIKTIVSNNGGVLLTNPDGEIRPYNNTVFLTIPDYKIYTITATDNAGNTASIVIQEKVDTTRPTLEIKEGSYNEGVWINTEALFNFEVSSGASGIKILFSTDGGENYTYFEEGEFLKEGDGTSHTQTIRASYIVTGEQLQNYKFKVESASGNFSIYDFGTVAIDKTNPLIIDNDGEWMLDLTPYVGDSGRWVNYYLNFKFIGRDGHETINSGIKSVTVDNDGEVVFHGDNKYSFEIQKCTEYIVTITDNAGNVSQKTYVAKVDVGEPIFEYVAYIGNTSEIYTFDEDMWLSDVLYGDNAFVRFVFDMYFSPSGAKMQYSVNNGTTWSDLSENLFEEGNEDGLEQYAQITIDVKNEQNNPYMVRMISGSGKIMEGELLGYIRIDFTPPQFSSMTFHRLPSRTAIFENIFTTTWGYDSIQARFNPFDSPSGIKTVEVKQFENGVDTTSENYTMVPFTVEAGTYSFNMDSHAQYVLTLADHAGNIYTHRTLVPKIDKTDGFDIAVDSNGYVSGDWLFEEHDNVRFDFSIFFDHSSGYTAFGESGGWVEFSVDNGQNWQTFFMFGEHKQEIVDNDTLSPHLIVSISQIRTYRFRVVSGAGRAKQSGDVYTVRKDIVLPNIHFEVKSKGNDYDGTSWVNADIDFMLSLTVGASQGQYFVATSKEASITSESQLDWRAIGNLGEGMINRVFTVQHTSDNVYYYFRLVAGTGRSFFTSDGSLVKIDRDEVSAVVNAFSDDALYQGEWTSKDVELILSNIKHGPSGISVSYQTRRIGQDTFGGETTTGYNPETHTLTLSNNTQHEYRLHLVGGSGIAFYTTITPVRIDKVVPQFSLITSGNQLKGTLYNDGWWTSDLSLTYSVNAGESGYITEYQVSSDGVLWEDWTSENIINNLLVLRDDTTKGGTINYYRFRVVSNAGESSAINEFGEIKIDTNFYTISAKQFVSSTEGQSYATVTNTGSTYTRGQLVTGRVNTLVGYYIKHLAITAGQEKITDIETGSKDITEISYDIELSGKDIEVTLHFYKEIGITYNNRLQHLQDREITEAFITVNENGFNNTYGELQFEVKYSGSDSVPQQIGVYDMSVSIEDDSFIIIEPSIEERQMVIVYFEGGGTYYEPYYINRYYDLLYIDYYMAEGYEYLGEYSAQAYFVQTADIVLPVDFIPVGTLAPFTGYYNGTNHKVSLTGERIVVTQDFGFFKEIGENATIQNLGVEIEDIVITADGVKVGLLASVVQEGAIVQDSYALGNVNIASGITVTVGGLIGEINDAILENLFADVSIYAEESKGHMGGLIGRINSKVYGAFLADTYAISQLTLVDCAEQTLSVGAIVGYIDGSFGYEIGRENYYLNSNITINSKPYSNLAFGNQGDWKNDGMLSGLFEHFLGNEYVIGDIAEDGWQDRTVGELSRYRIKNSNIVGLGVQNDPFIIDNVDKLALLEVFPFAYFEQTTDLVVGNYATLNDQIVFTGVYDGGLYSIINPIISGNGNYGAFIGILQGSIVNLRLVDIEYQFESNGKDSYVGGLIGVALNGSTVSNIIVSGAINASNQTGTLFAGGIAGVMQSSQIDNSISLVNINIQRAFSTVAGGVVAQLEGASTANSIVSLARITVNIDGSGYIGSSLGLVYDDKVSGNHIYNVLGNTFINGRNYEASIGKNFSTTLRGIASQTYDNTVSSAGGITIAGSSVLSLISGLYPFESGTGRFDDPFIVVNYRQLIRIGDYMYAAFALGNDIVIGDYDEDGVRDEDYNYDFDSIGKGAVFTGILDGKNPYSNESSYSITGLTSPLFEVNAGQIRNLTLNISYKAYHEGHSALAQDPSAKKLAEGESVVFGAIAKYNRQGGELKMVIVNGDIQIVTKGVTSIKAGGLIGVASGGTVIGSISYVNFYVEGLSADVGGVVGVIEGDTRVEGSVLTTLDFNIILENINAKGGSVNAGLIVGAILSPKALVKQDIGSNAKVYINGTEYQNRMIGKLAFLQ